MLIVANKKKLKKYFYRAVAVLILILCVLYFFNVAYPLVLRMSEAKAKAETLNSINAAAAKIRTFQQFFDKFYNYERNNDGDIVLITANTASINQMYIAAQAEIQKSLNELGSKTIEIPLGAFSGSAILADLGPNIDLNMTVVGTTEAFWNSYFYNEGINQTIHRVVLSLTTTLHILIPARAADITVTTDLIIAEDIIVGRIPDSYITGINKDNIFDLIP